jgi:hypothetical protein
MKIRVRKASDDTYESYAELKTIEDLLSFVEYNGEIVVGSMFVPEKDEYEIGITIYDDYVE